MFSPVTAVIKAQRSQTLHYRKDEIKTTSSFSHKVFILFVFFIFYS